MPLYSAELLILNFEENRRRSLLLWEGLPSEFWSWRPDKDAMTLLEMVRHVLESEHYYHMIMLERGVLGDYVSPWHNKDYQSLATELSFAQPYRDKFILSIRDFDAHQLETIEINRTDLGQRGSLGKYLLKAAYHESVHAGQFLTYLRTLNINRPNIWD